MAANTLMLAGALLLVAAAPGAAQPRGAEQRDMRLVGHHDLQARSAYQPVIHQQGARWIAYVGHHGGRKPNAHIPGAPGPAEAGGAAMVRVCDGKTLPKGDPAKTYLIRASRRS